MLASLTELMARVVGLPALITMVFDGFVEFVISLTDAFLAAMLVGFELRRSKRQEPCECGARNERFRNTAYL
jgi:hypothetical protein